MAEYLVIRLPRDPGQPASWIAVDETGARRSAPASGDLLEATAEVGDRKVVALVPSADVLTTTVDIPVKGAKLLRLFEFEALDTRPHAGQRRCQG